MFLLTFNLIVRKTLSIRARIFDVASVTMVHGLTVRSIFCDTIVTTIFSVSIVSTFLLS